MKVTVNEYTHTSIS